MEDIQMNSSKLQWGFISLISYMLTSARGLVDEPKIYGPSRLVEAAKRLINLAEDCGFYDASVSEVATQIEERRIDTLLKGEAEFIRFMDDLIDQLATFIRDNPHLLEDSDE
jgi:hypothetical protein